MPLYSIDIDGAPLTHIHGSLIKLQAAMVATEKRHAAALALVAEEHHSSARNLLHYIGLRGDDRRDLQTELAAAGLSSMGRSEAHVLSSVESLLGILDRALARDSEAREPVQVPCDLLAGRRKLESNSNALLGAEPSQRSVRVMVTMPSEAASDYSIIHDLLHNGMDCMRINCAHDDSHTWQRMIEHLAQARQALGRGCVILMDLAGPKLRTGAVESGPSVLKIRPERDAFGRVTKPARVWMTSKARWRAPSSRTDGVLHVDQAWLSAITRSTRVRFRDARERRRTLQVVDIDRGGCWAELTRTAYVVNGSCLERLGERHSDAPMTSEVSGIPPKEGRLLLCSGDTLLLTNDQSPGRPAVYDSAGRLLSPARIPCTLPEVFADIRAGERVYLDDGRIGGVIEAVSREEVRLRIDRTAPGGAYLGADKGINFPDSALMLPALTAKDLQDLAFAASHADMVGLSFANHERDVQMLVDELRKRACPQVGIILKIETRRGFTRLPAMLLTAMQHERFGVMIARGDLAVECGYERLAEVQEEILWLCEAAHCPTIWATQVLESLAKHGIPSRAEITDAAMSHRAECVMLNKGPYINEALQVLDNILRRMDAHQSKKRAMLRALKVAIDFANEGAVATDS